LTLNTLAKPESNNSTEEIGRPPWLEEVWGSEGCEFLMDIDEVPEPDWLVEGIVVRQGLTLVYGESQVGKTTFCLYLIDALDEGKPLFGRKCKQAKTILVEQDQSPPLMKAQKRKLGRPNKLVVSREPITWDNTEKKFLISFKAILDLKPDVVIIDAYTSLGIEDINHPCAGLVFDKTVSRMWWKKESAYPTL